MSIQKSRIFTVLRYVLPILLTLLWLSFIYGNSLKTGEQSSEQSGKVHEVVNDIAQSVGIEKPISEHTVRKSAHFFEFAVLGGLICLDLWAFRIVSLKKKLHTSVLLSLTSLPICSLLASIVADAQIFGNFLVGTTHHLCFLKKLELGRVYK